MSRNSYTYEFHSEEYRGCRIALEYDDAPFSPRENDNLGVILAWHPRYAIADSDDVIREAGLRPPSRSELESGDLDYVLHCCGVDFSKDVVLPLYLYDHGNIMLRAGGTGPGWESWDTSTVGAIVCTYERIRSEFNLDDVPSRDTICLGVSISEFFEDEETKAPGKRRVSKSMRGKVAEMLQHEVDYYSDYLSGDTFCFVVYDEQGAEIESLCGFIGEADREYAIDEARSIIDHRLDREEACLTA